MTWKKKYKPTNSKYSAKITEIDGMKFSSKLEAKYYSSLKIMQAHGDVSHFLRQVPFHLPGNVKYVVDFVVFMKDGTVNYVDVKGFDTPLSKTKRKIVEDLYPVKIEVVSR